MPRKGLPKVRTGCQTCKSRKVKCDESRPECHRCRVAGKKCDGYSTPPVGSYSWDELLRPRPRVAPPAIPGIESLELRNLDFFINVVAPSAAGPHDNSFWTHVVAQMAVTEPAARHAVVAISSLYEHTSAMQLANNPSSHYSENEFAISHYNSAIKHLVSPQASTSTDTVLLVCILFVYIEFMRGNIEGANTHIIHGIALLNSSKARPELATVFHHLSLVPFFFKKGFANFPLPFENEAIQYGPTYVNIPQAEKALDSILVRNIRLVRRVNTYRRGLFEPAPLEVIMQDHEPLNKDIDAWWAAFSILRDELHAVTEHRITLLLMELRWLAAKMRLDTYVDRDEFAWDSQEARFRRVNEIGRQVQAYGDLRAKSSRKFCFVMGFTPVFFWIVAKCRFLNLRLGALSFLDSLSWEWELGWDVAFFYGLGVAIIEMEHDIKLLPGGKVATPDVDYNTPLPACRSRVRDWVQKPEREPLTAPEDAGGYKRKMCFQMTNFVGEWEDRVAWVTVR